MDREERLRRQKEFLIHVAYWAVWVCVAMLVLKYVGSVLLPFVIAFLVAWVLSFPTNYFSEKTGMARSFVAVFMVALFYLAVAGMLYLLGSRIVGLIQDAFSDISHFLSNTMFPISQEVYSWMNQGVSQKVITGVSGAAVYIPEIFMKVLLAVIATVFTELEFPDILEFLERQIPKHLQHTVTEVRRYTVGTVGKCLLSYAVILGLTFAELTIGLLLLKVEGAVTIAFIIAILDILPVLETGTILLPWMIIAIASGNIRMGIGILVLYLVITVVRNIVEPRLVGSQMGLSPVVMLPCMILGLHFLGILGLFLVPYGVSFLKNLNDRGIIHLFKAKEKNEENYKV